MDLYDHHFPKSEKEVAVCNTNPVLYLRNTHPNREMITHLKGDHGENWCYCKLRDDSKRSKSLPLLSMSTYIIFQMPCCCVWSFHVWHFEAVV